MAIEKIGDDAGVEFDKLIGRHRMFKFLLRILFEIINEIRTLKGQAHLTQAQAKSWLRDNYVGP
ncbi:MAG: hypothetical protein ISR47_03655 [Rhodospirillales bacterium]|nr:hypothetical protein [Rhodospirillales bacterium]